MIGKPVLLAIACAVAILAGLADAASTSAQTAEANLRSQVDALASESGFAVTGLERIDDVAARPAPEGPTPRRIEELLKGYNYMIVHDQEGGIRELRILNRGPAPGSIPQRGVVKSERQGRHHVVVAELVGPNGKEETLRLVVDTGASTVVLPSSLMETLGFNADELDEGEAETANGTVPVRMGILSLVRVGKAEASDVEVGFIADEHVGDQRLLGMSFLERFRLTIDEKTNQVVLLPR